MSCSCNDCNDITLFSGNPGSNGVYGGQSSKWKFDGSTTAPGPSDTFIRFNNATLSSVTNIYVADKNSDSVDMSPFILSFDATGYFGFIRFFKEFDANTFWIGKVISSVDNTGSWTLTVEHIQSNGTFVTDDDIILSYTPVGDLGDWAGSQVVNAQTISLTSYSVPTGYNSLQFTNSSPVTKRYKINAVCNIGNIDGATFPLTAGVNVYMGVAVNGVVTPGKEVFNFWELPAAVVPGVGTGVKMIKTLSLSTIVDVPTGQTVSLQFKAVSGGIENGQLNAADFYYSETRI